MDLKQRLEREIESHKFIQLKALHDLITEESIQAHLNVTKPDTQFADLREITSKSPKLFAILVLLGRECTIVEYHSRDFYDRSFPVLKPADIPDIGYPADQQGIYIRQWHIPIVLKRSPHLNLPFEFVPPILEKCDVRNGSFGYVYKVRMADGHVPQYKSVRAINVTN